ncbi:MAG: CarD family transcriptional regulator [Porcipelethomonas sp.]
MDYKIGEHVVYSSGEICLVDGVVKRCFDGVHEEEYYRLIPISTKKSCYYIPCNNSDSKVRPLLTEEEIYGLIDEMSDVEGEWCEDKNERKNLFSSVLKGDDYHKLIKMMHVLYIQKENRRLKGKKLPAADERAMNEAERLIHQEFSFVLGIDEDKIGDFISSRINR